MWPISPGVITPWRPLSFAIVGIAACSVSPEPLNFASATAASADEGASLSGSDENSGPGDSATAEGPVESTSIADASDDGPSATNCGNGVIDAGEDCDGTALGSAACADFGFEAGTLSCSAACAFATSGCFTCGDGMASGPEACDDADFAGASCMSEGFDGGSVACNPDCTLDVSACTRCGDGVIDRGEACDSSTPATSCIDEGFEGGEIACAADCSLDTTGCYACGDGVVGGPEACDCGGDGCTAPELGGNECTDLPSAAGPPFSGGELGCSAGCTFDTSACTVCGDGVANGNESCDGDDLGSDECVDLGWLGGGTLSCAAGCSYDDSQCIGPLCGSADAGVGPCPAECSWCDDGFCVFDCPGDIVDGGPCNGLDLVCPAGWPCRLSCGEAGCNDTSFTCSDGVCEVTCTGINACIGTTVDCGIQSCAATCDIFSDPQLACNDACECSPC